MFRYLIIIKPLGLMYGSAGAFLSPENLVGRSGAKFPPEAAVLSGLFFSANWGDKATKEELKKNLFVAGPFWAYCKNEQNFYVPIPRNRIIAKEGINEWCLDKNGEWQPQKKSEAKLEPDKTWQTIASWKNSLKLIQSQSSAKPPSCAKSPWEYIPILHTRMKPEERHTLSKDGLFLENAVQMPEETCLVYLSTHKLPSDWYRFGGENHIVEIETQEIKRPDVVKLFGEKIQYAFALITPGVWGSTRFSYRYPQQPEHPDFPKPWRILTDKAVPYRYSSGGKLGRGRYAVPAGSVYVFEKPLNKSWWEWKDDLFPSKGGLKRFGCGLCLPIEIQGLPSKIGVA